MSQILPRITAIAACISLSSLLIACSPADSNQNGAQSVEKNATEKTWELASNTDPITGKATYAAIFMLIDYSTRQPADASLTIACNTEDKDVLNVAIASGITVKTAGFDSIGPTGRYTVKIDDKPHISGTTNLGSNNRVFVLTHEQSLEVTQQLNGAKKVLVQVTGPSDNSVTYDGNISDINNAVTTIKSNCGNFTS